jgi:hypothetical protein
LFPPLLRLFVVLAMARPRQPHDTITISLLSIALATDTSFELRQVVLMMRSHIHVKPPSR